MQNMTLSENSSRLVALALLCGALMLAYVVFVVPYVGLYSAGRARIDELAEELARYRQAVSLAPLLADRDAAVGAQARTDANFLTQETAALASAELQQYIKRAVSEAGGTLISTQALPSDERAEPIRVTVKVGMRGTSNTLYDLLYRLEGHQPVVDLDNLELRGLVRTGQVTRAGDMMDIRFDLTGYLRSVDP